MSPTSESEEEEVVDEAVILANQIADPLSTFATQYSNFTTNKDEKTVYRLQHFKSQNLTRELINWIFDLFKRNMKAMYESVWGWHPRKKKNELTEEAARYLIAFADNDNGVHSPVAFVHFRFDMDYGRTVLYIYEIQLESSVRSIGLGAHLMRCLEQIAFSSKMSLLVLTVFKANTGALEFFKRFGFEEDSTSPEEDEKEEYFVMSKKTNL